LARYTSSDFKSPHSGDLLQSQLLKINYKENYKENS